MTELIKHFDSLVSAAFPEGISQIQVDEMRKAFFAGAHALFAEIEKIEDPTVSEDEGVRRLTALRHEVNTFFHVEVLKVAHPGEVPS